MSKPRERYVAVKIDVVRSRRAKDRPALQASLFATAEKVNDRWQAAIASRFIVTHGDEVQGMLHWSGRAALLGCVEDWVDGLLPHKVRFGVGVGRLDTPVRPEAIGMDGEAWHRASDAVRIARNQRKHFALIGTTPDTDRALTALANLLLAVRYEWTPKQADAIRHVASSRTQAEAARKMRIAAATLSRHLSAANWDVYREGRETFVEIISRLGDRRP